MQAAACSTNIGINSEINKNVCPGYYSATRLVEYLSSGNELRCQDFLKISEGKCLNSSIFPSGITLECCKIHKAFYEL